MLNYRFWTCGLYCSHLCS
ncbi:UNVERIFIED_CONTAM: hypothetical protein GTU68_015383 [Idotea baltica]|nr:hypothetical protein [Idotea baltica]